MSDNSPVETIATKIDQSPTPIAVGHQGIQHCCGMVFRVGASHQGIVTPNNFNTLTIKLIIRDDVIVYVLVMQP